MIVLNSASRSHGHGWQTAVLACATVAVCTGVVPAQDYGAVGRRLKIAVQHGEITQQQAYTMMAALKNAAATNQDLAKAQAYQPTVKKKLATAVEASKTTKEDAVRKDEAAKRDMKKMAGQDPSHAGLDAVQKRLKTEVQADKMTKDEAMARRKAIKGQSRE